MRHRELLERHEGRRLLLRRERGAPLLSSFGARSVRARRVLQGPRLALNELNMCAHLLCLILIGSRGNSDLVPRCDAASSSKTSTHSLILLVIGKNGSTVVVVPGRPLDPDCPGLP